MSGNNIAIIVGGTGLVGSFVIQELVKDESFQKIYVLNRREIGYQSDKIKELVVDLNQLDGTLKDVVPTHAFCTLGTTIKKAGSKDAFRKVDYDYVMNFASAVHKIGCTNFNVVTALGTSKPSRIFYNQVKYEVTESLKKLGFAQLNILQPSLLMGHREEGRLGEDIGQKIFNATRKLWVGPLKNYAGIHGQQVAKAMVAISKNNQEGVHFHSSGELQDY